jgi:hypothetical protein
LKIGRYDIIDDGTAVSDIKGQLRGSLENVQTCPVEVSMGLKNLHTKVCRISMEVYRISTVVWTFSTV